MSVSCSKEVTKIDIASNLVGNYQGVLVDELNDIIESNAVVTISKISNAVIRIEAKDASSQIASFEVNIIKNSNTITNAVNNSSVILIISLIDVPFKIGIDYSDTKTTFTGIKVN